MKIRHCGIEMQRKRPRHPQTTLRRRAGAYQCSESTHSVLSQARRGSQVLIIHPGSRYLRVGRASDVTPAAVLNVLARKTQTPPKPVYIENISRPATRKPRHGQSSSATSPVDDEYGVQPLGDDPVCLRVSIDPGAKSQLQFERKLAETTSSLRERMRFYKLRVTPNAAHVATTFNQSFQPEIIPGHNDSYQLEWIDQSCKEDVLIGEKVDSDDFISNVHDLSIFVGPPHCRSGTGWIRREMADTWIQLQYPRLYLLSHHTRRH